MIGDGQMWTAPARAVSCVISSFRPVAEEAGTVRASKIAIPEVIALRAFDKVPLRQVTFSRRNIYEHYGYRCCYCGRRFPTQDLNLDHIVPRSRGGHTDWMNVVTSCVRCNLKKGDRLPSEAGMRMVIAPSRPNGQARAALLFRAPFAVRRSWQRFVDNLYWNVELDQE
mgnify:CR=1 FL=1